MLLLVLLLALPAHGTRGRGFLNRALAQRAAQSEFFLPPKHAAHLWSIAESKASGRSERVAQPTDVQPDFWRDEDASASVQWSSEKMLELPSTGATP